MSNIDQGAVRILALLVGSVLVLAAFVKLRNRRSFRDALNTYRLLPSTWVRPAAIILPWLELLIGILLLAGSFRPIGEVLAAVLFSIFATAVAVRLLQGDTAKPCGCFGTGRISWGLVIRNSALAVALLASVLSSPVQGDEPLEWKRVWSKVVSLTTKQTKVVHVIPGDWYRGKIKVRVETDSPLTIGLIMSEIKQAEAQDISSRDLACVQNLTATSEFVCGLRGFRNTIVVIDRRDAKQSPEAHTLRVTLFAPR